ncbi:hypothetical protein QA640_18000 [Bradyrhizobium sp. CB82]|nr:hypothetical protein [Bradyrhizobium sp. CB82]WFU44173.1 hypothetical protein QA640_18000 [Bradyrhizobium sp. CB82]
MAGKPKEDEHEDRRHADKPPADTSEHEQSTADKPEDPPPGVPPYKD